MYRHSQFFHSQYDPPFHVVQSIPGPTNMFDIPSINSMQHLYFTGQESSWIPDVHSIRCPDHENRPPPQVFSCGVCEEPAGKHCYYGGRACTSCRAFFRRSVASGAWLRYFCTKRKECIIRLKTRKKCQYCRYQACLKAGMRTKWVLNEEEKERFLNARRKNFQQTPKVCETPRFESRLPEYITSIEMQDVNEYVRLSQYFEKSKVKDMDTKLIRELIRLKRTSKNKNWISLSLGLLHSVSHYQMMVKCSSEHFSSKELIALSKACKFFNNFLRMIKKL